MESRFRVRCLRMLGALAIIIALGGCGGDSTQESTSTALSSTTTTSDDHSNSTTNATPVEIGLSVHGELEYGGDRDVFVFEATEGELYELDGTLQAGLGVFLALHDDVGGWADGFWLAGGVGYGGSTPTLLWFASSAGTYYVEVTSLGASTGTYTFTIAVSDFVDDHPNSTTNATPVELGTATQGESDYKGDADFFAFEAEEGELYDLGVAVGSLHDSVVAVFDAHGNYLAHNFDYGDSGASRLIWQAPATGTYNVRVSSSAPAGTGTYALTIAVSDIVDDHPNSTTNATPVEIGLSVHGELEYGGDRDVFAFEATEGEFYDLDVTLGTPQDPGLSVLVDVLDANGKWLYSTRDYSTRALQWFAPSTDTYYVRVTNDGTGTYTLTITIPDIEDDHPNTAEQ